MAVVQLTLDEIRQLAREDAERYADLLNQGFQDPTVEKVRLSLLTGGTSTEDGDDLTKYKASADDGILRIDGPRYTLFVTQMERVEGIGFEYRRKREGQYL